jgi:hypothetical protein
LGSLWNQIPLWGISIASGVGAVLLFIMIFSRLESIGYYHHWWKLQDVRMCKTYWQLAPKLGWSRFPLVAAVTLLAAACVTFFITLGPETKPF